MHHMLKIHTVWQRLHKMIKDLPLQTLKEITTEKKRGQVAINKKYHKSNVVCAGYIFQQHDSLSKYT